MTASTMPLSFCCDASGRSCVELLQVGLDIRREGGMVDQPVEMTGRPRERLPPLLVQDRREASLVERWSMVALVQEQAELGHEADIRQRYTVAYQEASIRLQGLVDPRSIDREGLPRPRMDIGREAWIAQGKEINLRIARKD